MPETDRHVNNEGQAMGMQAYKGCRFTDESLAYIEAANVVINDFVAQGFRLTLRQLYYQFVARDLFRQHYRYDTSKSKWVRDPNGTINAEPNYDMLGNLINNARLAGLIDWDALEDRTRAFVRRSRWESGRHILQTCVDAFHMDMWSDQPCRLFVIVEKEALVGVCDRTCREFDVPLLAAKGYPSVSVLREFVVEDILPALSSQQHIAVIHLGDHDPSGIDMTRDLRDRIELFCEGGSIELVRIALNMPQIEALKPPPNPAKTTDSRFIEYRRLYGDESWELDALQPSYLANLLETEIDKYRDVKLWDARAKTIEDTRAKLARVTKRFKA